MLINTALCLSESDVEALSKGRMVAALSRTFINNSIQPFALCPVESIDNNPTISMRTWARVEFCKIYNDPEDIDKLAQITIWSNETLQKILEERYNLFLVCLRVYELPQPVDIPANQVRSRKIGSFIKLPHSLSLIVLSPVLDNSIFEQRKQQLANLELPLYPELERLHDEIAQLAITDLKSKEFEQDIKAFLGWSDSSTTSQYDPDLSWIKTIADVGNSSNGDLFEKLVRKSFIKLGFKNSNVNLQTSLDPDGCGGAGGLDFYCEEPYPVVGECKATKSESVPDSTPAQLVKLGLKHLSKQQYENSLSTGQKA
jgi:hypothetical protein